MKKLRKKYPDQKKEFSSFEELFSKLKTIRQTIDPPMPTGNLKKDVYISHFPNYINLIYLKFIHQVQYFKIGLIAENPEIGILVRTCLETISALYYVSSKALKLIDDSEKLDQLVFAATLGAGKRPLARTPPFESAPEIFNILDCVRETNKFLNKQGVEKDAFSSTYDFYSEILHPNYLSLANYWQAIKGKRSYNYETNLKCLRPNDLKLHLNNIINAMLTFELVLKNATNNVEKKLKAKIN